MEKKKLNKFQKALVVVKNNIQLKIGLTLLCILLLIAVLGPVFAPYSPKLLNNDLLEPPGSKYLLGTDNLGHDIFSQILYGA